VFVSVFTVVCVCMCVVYVCVCVCGIQLCLHLLRAAATLLFYLHCSASVSGFIATICSLFLPMSLLLTLSLSLYFFVACFLFALRLLSAQIVDSF